MLVVFVLLGRFFEGFSFFCFVLLPFVFRRVYVCTTTGVDISVKFNASVLFHFIFLLQT